MVECCKCYQPAIGVIITETDTKFTVCDLHFPEIWEQLNAGQKYFDGRRNGGELDELSKMQLQPIGSRN
jgi:hypothetical protein